MKRNLLKEIFKLVICIAAPLLAGFIGSLFTTPAIPDWYASLNKPFFNPPNWIFAPVWTVLYILMGLAAYLIWRGGLQQPKAKAALRLFIIQLILNCLWSIVFFGLRSPLAGMVVIILLWLAIFIAIKSFYQIFKPAAYLLAPYLLWVSFAALLNGAIVFLN